MQIINFFTKGLRKTLRLTNGVQMSYAGPWANVMSTQVIDSWYVGDFMSADYTISVDKSTGEKEIIKCLVVAGPNNAAVTIYGRTSLVNPLVTIEAAVTSSKLDLSVTPVNGQCKVIFSANYYQTLNPIVTN